MDWFKFYSSDWLSDLKIGRLSEVDRLVFITLLCVTNVTDRHGARDGRVQGYDEDEIIRLTRLTREREVDARGVTQRLTKLGIVDVENDGTLIIKNYEKRQTATLSDAERARRYRSKRREDDRHEDRHDKVTPVTTQRHGRPNERHDREDKSRVEKIRENKHTHGEHQKVLLTAPEYQKLVDNFGERNAGVLIQELDSYIESRGLERKYKSHYATLLNWGKRKIEEFRQKQSSTKPKIL